MPGERTHYVQRENASDASGDAVVVVQLHVRPAWHAHASAIAFVACTCVVVAMLLIAWRRRGRDA